jgi:hypothetical protein
MKNKKDALWFFKNGILEPVLCKTCKKNLSKKQLKDKHKFCSVRCAQNNKEVRDKFTKTSLNVYGTKNPSQNQKVKIKSRKTCKEKYGV